MEKVRFAGFWIRCAAMLIDCLIIFLLTFPLLYYIYGDLVFTSTKIIKGPADFIISIVVPTLLAIVLWIKFKGTPGKTMLGLNIVDFKTGGALNVKQSILRQIGYLIMILPIGLGFILIAFDPKKRGWHDKMAESAVVYKKTLPQNQGH
jgi:uncharacterized RDD family membrane protein YckC